MCSGPPVFMSLLFMCTCLVDDWLIIDGFCESSHDILFTKTTGEKCMLKKVQVIEQSAETPAWEC